jgi:hypothetical protein
MKTITKYVSADGLEFNTERECVAHEFLCEDVRRAESRLLPRIEGPAFDNGEGFVQQSGPVVLTFQRYLIRELQKRAEWGLENWDAYLTADYPIGGSYMGRVMSEAAPKPVRDAWWRIHCMDLKFREYGQPYYAAQADKRGS